MWLYNQTNGQLSHDGALVAVGYSGFGYGKNNHGAQALANIGPIPVGSWEIGDIIDSTPLHGPFVLPLTPFGGTNTFGRSGFLIHGESIEAPGCASRGCIILPRWVRAQMGQSSDKGLEVV
jgi:hypothetical protein